MFTHYVNPDKVYVVTDVSGVPVKVVQSKELAEMWSSIDGGKYFLVQWYSKNDFYRDFPEQRPVTYDNYIPSWKNPGSDIYAPDRRYRF